MKHATNNHVIVLQNLLQIPKKILSIHGHIDNVPDFVLHELCHENCLNIERAAYFIDNPDFNQLKGVSGYCKREKYTKSNDIWQEAADFNEYMKQSEFNQKIRKFSQNSLKRCVHEEEDIISDIAQDLEFEKYGYCTWNMKHDNHGIFIYKKIDDTKLPQEELLFHGLHLLGFCPIF